ARVGLAAGAADAQSLPFPHRHHARAIGEHEIEAFRHHDLVTPGLAGDPAVLLEVVRGRRDHVGYRVDNVAAAVAVEVAGVALERRPHELGRAESAGPRALEMIRLDVAARENLQRGEKFLAEIILVAADKGESRRRTDHRALADMRAGIGFEASNSSAQVATDHMWLIC